MTVLLRTGDQNHQPCHVLQLVIRGMLRKLGIDCKIAADGQQAVEIESLLTTRTAPPPPV
jgi:hypothetical protein